MDDRHAPLDPSAAQALLGCLNFSDGRPDPRWQKQLNDAFAAQADAGAGRPGTPSSPRSAPALATLHAAGGAAFRDAPRPSAVLALAARNAAGLPPPPRRPARPTSTTPTSSGRSSWPASSRRACPLVTARPPTAEPSSPGSTTSSATGPWPCWKPGRRASRTSTSATARCRSTSAAPASPGAATAPRRARPGDPARHRRRPAGRGLVRPDLLDEVALDLRAYDHGHPVNRRPNYVFGECDPHHIDDKGRYSPLRRPQDHPRRPHGPRRDRPARGDPAERLAEGAAVLAGTMLMAAGVSGWGPAPHDSVTTLAVLLPRIARYRRCSLRVSLHISNTHSA